MNWADEGEPSSMFNYKVDDDEGWQDAVSDREKKRRNRRAQRRKMAQLSQIAEKNPHFIDRKKAMEIQEVVKVQGFTPFILSEDGIQLQTDGVLIGFEKSSEGHIDLCGNQLNAPDVPYEYITIPGNNWNDRCIFAFP